MDRGRTEGPPSNNKTIAEDRRHADGATPVRKARSPSGRTRSEEDGVEDCGRKLSRGLVGQLAQTLSDGRAKEGRERCISIKAARRNTIVLLLRHLFFHLHLPPPLRPAARGAATASSIR
ncbi:hypothetical protein NDU88_002860 [Pleurodeles waltl]|uniref:Uncharacterized protein n=1 Tax=Pleurodeles waltl TaxID=8319 RepID=A0AAV7WRD6_PLEWA|nr:hypothetical protein NDU88_002860 [Pleurodeles waltl]